MESFEPISKIRINDFIKIAAKSWPKEHYREITELETIKNFYNTSYQNFHSEIETILNRYHPAAWVRIAYVQLELWTIGLFKAHHENKDFAKAPYLFIPIARYGWRYILEISLERLESYDYKSYNDIRPNNEDISEIFTLLIGLSYCNELSNYIHYFKNHFKNGRIVFSNTLYARFPDSDSKEESFFKELMNYLHDESGLDQLPQFDYRNNPEILKRIDSLLLTHFNFTIKDIDIISETLREKIMPKIGASNLIMPTTELVAMLHEESKLEVTKVISIVTFIFFDTQNFNYEKRNFLQKSQNIRMLNFGACKFKLDNNLKTIYDDKASEWDYIKSSEHHSIVSFILLEEWKLNFISRLIYGQRTDLKNLNKELKDDISKIEHFFHKNVFENALKNLLQEKGLPCISLDKINKVKISCGEIDALAIDQTNKIIYLIEAKNLSPSKDARSFGKVISDHYEQKKYHEKFLRKIKWTEDNISELFQIFKLPVGENFKIEKYFITGSPSPLKFIVTDYIVLTYFEFYKVLNQRYEKN